MNYLLISSEITEQIFKILTEAAQAQPDYRKIEDLSIGIENLAFMIAEDAKDKAKERKE